MSAELTFMFAGRTMVANEGDTIASALIKNNQLAFRTTEENKSRGLFCGMGVCNECTVTVDGKTGVLACLTPVQMGMNIDLQYQYRDAPNPESEFTQLPEITKACDVLIIGAGPAGLAAAKELAKDNLKIILVDERKSMGGQYFKQPAEKFEIPISELDAQFLEGRAIIDAVKKTNIEVITNTKIWGAFDADHLLGYNDENRFVFKAKNLVIATGAYERGIPIPNWTLPGVYTTGAAQTLLRSYQTPVTGRIIVCGNGPLNLQMAAELLKSNANVIAYVDSAKLFSLKNLILSPLLAIISPKLGLRGLGYLAILIRNKVKLISNSVPTKFIGKDLLTDVNINKLNNDLPDPTRSTTYKVDSVSMGFGFAPSNEIAKLLSCQLKLDKRTMANVVQSNFAGKTSKKNVWVVGDSAAINGAQIAKYRGRLLALKLLTDLNKAHALTKIEYFFTSISLLRHLLFQKVLWQIFKGPRLVAQLADEETIICRCLNVTVSELHSEVIKDVESAGAVKRITRAGMGKCQGRYCSPVVQELLSTEYKIEVDEFSGFAPQVPIKPTPISVIAYPFE